MSIAAQEAFALLNAGIKKHWRGWGDTATAARDRAAREAGISPAQAERIWKRWQQMKTVNGDVYRALRNTYGHLCAMVEAKADGLEREARRIEEINAAFERASQTSRGLARAAARAKERGRR